MIATMIDPYPCPRVLDDIDSLQIIVSSSIELLMIFHQKVNNLFSIWIQDI